MPIWWAWPKPTAVEGRCWGPAKCQVLIGAPYRGLQSRGDDVCDVLQRDHQGLTLSHPFTNPPRPVSEGLHPET